MKKIPSLASVMTPFPYAIDADKSVAAAEAMMEDHDFHHLPVTRAGELVGAVSARDLNLINHLEADAEALSVSAVYRPNPYVVDIATPLRSVIAAMATRHIGATLITRQNKLVGILTYADVARLLGQTFDAIDPPPDQPA